MEYEIRDEDGHQVVALSGEVDLSCSQQAREIILRSLTDGRHTLVDLGGVRYIDSSGLASLVEGYQKARQGDLGFGLVCVSEEAMKVLQLARLDQVFPIHDTVQAVGPAER